MAAPGDLAWSSHFDDMSLITDNLEQVNATIASACARAGRASSDVTLVAVSKTHPPELILEAAKAGVQHFGENRVEEAETKIPTVNQRALQPITWHMVGHIQSRKAAAIPGFFQIVHSIDSVKLARKLSAHLEKSGAMLDVLMEVNVSGEDTKSGFAAVGWETKGEVREALGQDVRQILAMPCLRVRGLMTMAPIVQDMEQARSVFRSLAALRGALTSDLGVPLPDLSMGMTDDYPVAIEEGATIIRIGRAIFGERQK